MLAGYRRRPSTSKILAMGIGPVSRHSPSGYVSGIGLRDISWRGQLHVLRVCADGSGVADTVFTTNRATLNGLDIDGSGVYFLTSFDSEVGGAAISRSPLLGDAAPTRLFVSQENMNGLAVDDAFIYFVESSNDATWRIPKNGGSKQLFADPTFRGADPDSLIADGAALYWVDGDTIYKKAR
jgi:hypothetical protein